jgi:hypothetical protein
MTKNQVSCMENCSQPIPIKPILIRTSRKDYRGPERDEILPVIITNKMTRTLNSITGSMFREKRCYGTREIEMGAYDDEKMSHIDDGGDVHVREIPSN